MSPVHPEPQYSIPYTPRSSMWPSPFCFPMKQRCAPILFSMHDIRPFHPFFSDHPRNIWYVVQTEKIHFIQFSPSPYYFLPHGPTYKTPCIYKHLLRKSCPVTGPEGPTGFQEVKFLRFCVNGERWW